MGSTVEFDPTAFENFDLSTVFTTKDENAEEGEGDALEGGAGQGAGHSRAATPTKQAVLFVIDCSHKASKHLPQKLFETQRLIKDEEDSKQPSLSLKPKGADPSLWQEVFHAISSTMRSRILANPYDKIGVLLFGVGSPTKECAFPGIHNLVPLDFLSASQIRFVEAQSSNASYRSFSLMHKPPMNDEGKQVDAKVSDLFWYISQVFSTSSNKKQYSNKVILFTANDDPATKKSERAAAIQRARDVQQDIADVELIPLALPDGEKFDFTKFYVDLLMTGDISSEDLNTMGQLRLETLSSYFRKKEIPQRVLSQVPFSLWDSEVSIGMNFYTSVLEQKVPPPFFLNANDNKPLKTQTQWICETTGSLLAVEQMRQYVLCGGEKVSVSRKEKSTLTHFSFSPEGAPHIHLLGFKPRSRLKLHHNIRHPSFLYPNEDRIPHGIKGGAAVVAGLLASMKEHDLVAIVRYAPRYNAIPRLGALIPQFEEIDDDDVQITPPGFHLIPLPFAEDVRKLDTSQLEGTKRANPARVAILKKAIKGLRLGDFHPRQVMNPVIQKHYAGLEALALGLADPPPIQDAMLETPPGMDRIASVITAWKDKLVEEVGPLMAASTTSSGAKRKATGAAGDAATAEEVEAAFKLGTLPKFLVSQLKGYLASINLPISGKKGDLISRIETHLAVPDNTRKRSSEVRRGETSPSDDDLASRKAKKKRTNPSPSGSHSSSRPSAVSKGRRERRGSSASASSGGASDKGRATATGKGTRHPTSSTASARSRRRSHSRSASPPSRRLRGDESTERHSKRSLRGHQSTPRSKRKD